jgi:transcription factor E2F3
MNSNNNPQIKKKRQRQENSLGELTKNFIEFVRSKGEEQVNINDIVKKLKVKKRRIYDITNVLEGIGYIKKLEKNKIVWIKRDIIKGDNYTGYEGNDYLSLQSENEKLEKYIQCIQNKFKHMSELPDSKEYAYVTIDDLQQIAKTDEQNLIAIKAPLGTTIEIPDKESAKEAYDNALKDKEEDTELLESLKMEHQMFMESQNGEITVYLVLGDNENGDSNNNNILSYKK